MASRKGGKGKKREFNVKLIGTAIGAALIMFVVGYFVAVRILFPPLPEPKTGIVVPKLLGMSVSQAEARLVQLGLRVSEVIDIAHPTQPPGVIIAQSPLPGQQLRTAGAVQLGVSVPMPVIEVKPEPAPAPDTTVAPVDTTTKVDSTVVAPPDTLGLH